MKHKILRCLQTLSILIPVHGITTSLAAADQEILLTVRGIGDFSDSNPIAPHISKTVALKDLKWQERTLFDTQYQAEGTYKLISLQDLSRSLTPPAHAGFALLHSAEGMIIPLESAQLAQVFLASEVKTAGKWSREFEQIKRKDPKYWDPVPLNFDHHKLVYPGLPGKGKLGPEEFTPWRHFGSLKSIEFVNRTAYYDQFQRVRPKKEKASAIDPSIAEGKAVFQKRCQYCHGIRGIGASWGWDFVKPLPIFKKRTVDSLFVHVKFQKDEAIKEGILMPHQKDFTKAEAHDLWRWLRSVSSGKLTAYSP